MSTSTQNLIKHLESALEYEANMERGLTESDRPASFLPAAKIAYQRILTILSKPCLAAGDMDMIHAELLGVFEQPHYHGIVLWFASEQVDDWLLTMHPEEPRRPSLVEAYRRGEP